MHTDYSMANSRSSRKSIILILFIFNVLFMFYHLNKSQGKVTNFLSPSFVPMKTDHVVFDNRTLAGKQKYECNGRDENLRFCRLHNLLSGEKNARHFFVSQAEKGHYISACVAVKLAGDLIHEFLVSNYLAGIDHFYLYDDNDEDSGESLQKLVRQFEPLVTIRKSLEKGEFKKLLKWDKEEDVRSFKNRQHWMYYHCFKVYGKSSTWLLPIDVDEILESKRPQQHDKEGVVFEDVPFMQTYLKRIENKVPAQIGRWNTVLTNGIITPAPPSTTTLSQQYPKTCGYRDKFRNPLGPGFMHCAKSAIQPKYLNMDVYTDKGLFFVHGIKHWEKDVIKAKVLWFVEPYKKYSVPVNTEETEWYLNHYWSRSLGDYLAKKQRGRADGLGYRKLDELLEREKDCLKDGSYVESMSAKRRQGVIRYLLGEVDAYEMVQLQYYSIALNLLKSKRHSEFVKGYKSAMKHL